MGGIGQATKRAVESLSLEEQIRQRAYELYVQRGSESGSPMDDWLQAEREILASQAEQVEEERS